MKRLLIGSLLALGFALTATPARADVMFDYNCCRHFSYVRTSKSRCFTFSSHANPLPCAPACGGYAGPAMFDGYAAYGAPGYGYPAPVAAAPAAPAATTPAFQAPQPRTTPSNTSALQQAAYYYYAQPSYSSYGNNAGYSYGYGYGYGYSQAPNYWY